MQKKARTQPDDEPDDEPEGLTHNPFAALRPEGNSSPSDVGSTGAPHVSESASDRAAEPHPQRILVQREKKGRAGKTVTRVSGLEHEASALAQLSRELKRALGCGATVEGTDLLLQGALTERAARWLRARFDTDVTIGN